MHKMPRVVLDAPKTPGPKITSDSRTAIKLHAVTFEKPFSLNVQTYKMDCYFRQSWVDRRLSFEGSLRTLTVSINFLDRMWKPDTHFFNGRASYLHMVTTPNKLLRIDQDGRILYSMR